MSEEIIKNEKVKRVCPSCKETSMVESDTPPFPLCDLCNRLEIEYRRGASPACLENEYNSWECPIIKEKYTKVLGTKLEMGRSNVQMTSTKSVEIKIPKSSTCPLDKRETQSVCTRSEVERPVQRTSTADAQRLPLAWGASTRSVNEPLVQMTSTRSEVDPVQRTNRGTNVFSRPRSTFR